MAVLPLGVLPVRTPEEELARRFALLRDPSRPTCERLLELEDLRWAGAVSPEQYEVERAAIASAA